MDENPARRKTRVLRGLLALALAALACSLPFVSEDTGTGEPVTAAEGGSFEWPDAGTLVIPPDALESDTHVSVSASGESPPMAEESPLEPIGDAIIIDLGGVKLQDRVTMHIPLPPDLPDPALHHLLVRRVAPGEPIMLLALDLETDGIAFTITGEGSYQLISMNRLDRAGVLAAVVDLGKPLNVPVYPQIASDWCSPTALTMLAQYHQGAWPAGGTGSKWGETSSWYLTGLAHQPSNVGNFFHSLLRAGGYNPPLDVKQSFTDENMEVIIWNWNDAIYNQDTGEFFDKHYSGQTNMEKVEALYDAFRDYVESYFWGMNGPRKPVAWGSGMIAHSRVLTGSDGENLYYNEPGNGDQNVPMSWDDHHAAVLASLTDVKEVIDTVVILSDPRPAEELRGVIWLTPMTSFTVSSIILQEVMTGTDICYWFWDGSGTRNGYYFDEQGGLDTRCKNMPANAEYDRSFDITQSVYQIALTYYAINTDDVAHDYLTAAEVYPDGGVTPILITHQQVKGVPPHTGSGPITAELPLNEALGSGRHILKFTLWLYGIMQDTKYVAFTIADYTGPLPVVPTDVPIPTVTPVPPTPQPAIVMPTQVFVPTAIAPIIPSLAPIPSCSLGSPILREPSTTWTVTTSPTLEWMYFSMNCWPTSFRIQVATDVNFSNKVITESVTGNSYVPQGLQLCTTYYWRVAGEKDGGRGPWSSTWSFTPGDARQCGG